MFQGRLVVLVEDRGTKPRPRGPVDAVPDDVAEADVLVGNSGYRLSLDLSDQRAQTSLGVIVEASSDGQVVQTWSGKPIDVWEG